MEHPQRNGYLMLKHQATTWMLRPGARITALLRESDG
jgi:hypothetical protein